MKRVILFLVCIALLLPAAGSRSLSAEPTEQASIHSYTDIPNITQEEIDAIETLKKQFDHFSYGYITTKEAFQWSDGTEDGFIFEFCDRLSGLFGIPFTPEYYPDWADLRQEFDSLNIDFLGDLTATPERRQYYHMTQPIAERTLVLYSHQDRPPYDLETDLDGLNIGFFSDTVTASFIRKIYPIQFTAFDIRSYAHAAEMLQSGEIDAFVMETISEPFVEEYDFIRAQSFFPLVYTSVSLSTANQDLKPIITAVDKYLAAGGFDELFEMYQRGEWNYVKNKLEKSFTDQEWDYINTMIQTDTKVQFAPEGDNYPISFYNEEDEEYQGVALDILAEISQLTGLSFAPATEPDTPWKDIMEKLRSGEIDMVSELVYSEERSKDFIWASIPTISSNYALLSKTETPDIKPQQVSRTKVGVMAGSIYEDIYRGWYANAENLRTYPSQIEAFDAMERGEIDMLLATELLLYTQTNYWENPGYKVNVTFKVPVDSQYGFPKSETTLCSIVDKAMSHIDIEAIDRSWTNRSFNYMTKMTNMQVRYLVLFAAVLLFILIVVAFLFIRTKRLSNDLARQTEEAKVASRTKSAFLTNMSHEIRTPLNAIIGMAGIAKKSMADTTKAVSAIEQVITSSNHLLGILNNVLDMSKIESGKLEISNTPFELLDAYAELEGILGPRCHEKNIRFITNMHQLKSMVLVGDKLRVNQVLINLLGNSVKFTEPGGVVQLTVTILNESESSVKMGFTVADNGIGMNEEQLKKLFVPFEQTDKTIAAKFGGTGLGLSISQNLIELMGGHIKVKSIPDVGTKFTFELEFEKGTEANRQTIDLPPVLDLSGKRILLVEDIDINRIIIKENLAETGVEIQETANGAEAVSLFDSLPYNHFDLIFMDILMPEMDGYEATRRIRAMPRPDAKTVPIIAMTANAYKEDIRAALESGMDGHLAKPVDVTLLMRTLAGVFAQTNPQ